MSDTQRWIVSAGTPNGRVGERRGWVDVPASFSEAEARDAYLRDRPATWVIQSIVPDSAPADTPSEG